jgi:hypothetical protein
MKKHIPLIASIFILVLLFLVYKKAPHATLPLHTKAVSDIRTADIEIHEKTNSYTIDAKAPHEDRDTENKIGAYIDQLIVDKKADWESTTGKEAETLRTLTIDVTKHTSTTRDLVSYVVTAYAFSGGAHGDTTTHVLTFGKNGYKTPEEILNFEKDLELTKLIYAHALKDTNLLLEKDTLAKGLGVAYLKKDGTTFDAEKCGCDGFFFGSNLQEFFFDGATAHFLFAPYTIAAGAVGTVEIEVPLVELEPYMIY